ncbi:MAG: hypothetical protein UR60_C0010G0024 [Candidatus Moranbacteria bacterium GW2011_GWF2_34_56]|nr:MAG: hypothetical protein UR51_C0001G0047 [Candidatus Moranbacteria bacterium GW2011_GWF1_34_10]KKP65035.1 MAG: hypothetical protein UR60_C0010G0024 [Candidatus Moranbacteria bacterium GW2011_GWF2_34_56]HBI16944.1 hypothetical protein [Candidatus Moranbacteria bacterium]
MVFFNVVFLLVYVNILWVKNQRGFIFFLFNILEGIMKNFFVCVVLCAVIFGSSLFSIAQEISLGGIMTYSNSDISIEVNFVKMEGEFCIVDVTGKYRGVELRKKRKRVHVYSGEEYVDLTPHHKLTIFYAGTNKGEVYTLLNGDAI